MGGAQHAVFNGHPGVGGAEEERAAGRSLPKRCRDARLLQYAFLGRLGEHVERLFETAYALSCDVAAADGTLDESELRLLEEIRYELTIDRLHAAAIERGARARHMRA